MNRLRISDSLTFPLDFVTSTSVILAQKGKGKTHTARALAEELMEAGQQVVALDPTDAWWGLRSSKDGKTAGYPIAVFGGDHGDVPLEPGGGALLAEAIVAERFSAVISTENFRKAQELTFVADFLETLYRLNRAAMHLFVDEADIFAPQKPFGGEMRTCGAADDIVRRGRKKGIGCTLITQRSSVLNKNVLSQADMLVALGCSHPLDLDAIGEWVKRHADPKLAKQMMESLPSLPRGEAWVWNPAAEIFKRVQVRDLRTFDSGATPKAGEKAREAKVLAKVDIERLGASIAAQVQRAKENDPSALKAELAKARKDLAAAQSDVKHLWSRNDVLSNDKLMLKAKPTKTVLLDPKKADALVEKIQATQRTLGTDAEKILTACARMETVRVELDRTILTLIAATTPTPKIEFKPLEPVWLEPKGPAIAPVHKDLADTIERNYGVKVPRAVAPAGHRDVKPQNVKLENGVKLEPRHLKVLQAIGWWRTIGVHQPTAMQVAFVAGFSPTSSSWEKMRGFLRSSGLIDYPTPGTIAFTVAGELAAPQLDAPSTLGVLHGRVLEQLKPVQQRMMKPLLDAYPDPIEVAELGVLVGASHTSSSFEKVRGRLRMLGVADYPRAGYIRASEMLFPAVLS